MSKKNKRSNNGFNRQQKREAARKPVQQKPAKPLGMRIAIIVMLLVMLIGFILLPLFQR